jgi:hypothetical protein
MRIVDEWMGYRPARPIAPVLLGGFDPDLAMHFPRDRAHHLNQQASGGDADKTGTPLTFPYLRPYDSRSLWFR